MALAGLGTRSGYAATDGAWNQLRAHLRGRLVLPADSGYTLARQLDLGQFDAVNPQGVAYCADSADVATCLRFAQDQCLPFAIRSGGHSGGGYSTSPGVVIDVSALNSVTVGPTTAVVGGGTVGADITSALSGQGLAIPTGYCPSVAVGGYYQGGGMGALVRSVGMGSDRLVSARVVLADGRTVTASATRNPDLFWALRGGGGGNFGVVTSYEVLHTTVPQVALTRLDYSYDDAARMLDGYTRWLADAPRTIGSASFVQLLDASPGKTPTPIVFLLSLGTTTELTEEAARLVSLTGAPASWTPVVSLPYATAMMSLYGCTDLIGCHRADTTPGGTLPRQEFGLLRSRMFSGPPPLTMWEQSLAVFDEARLAGHARQLEVWAFDGAVHDVAPTATAFVHRDSLISVSFLGSITSAAAADASGRAAAGQFADTGFAVLDPHSSGETYQNFADAGLADWKEAYYGQNYARLSAVKNAYDPHHAFRFAQSIR